MAPQLRIELEEAPTRFEIAAEQPLPGVSPAGISEAFPLEGARTLYGATKLAAELLIEEYRAGLGVPAVIDRCGVIAGPWQMGKVDQGVFTHWMLAHHFGNPLTYIGFGGEGKQVRDLLHVEDLVDLVERQLLDPGAWDGRTVNVGGGRECSLSLQETTAICRQLTGNEVPIEPVLETRQGDVPIYLSDCARLFGLDQWRPRRSASQVLTDIHEWVASDPERIAAALNVESQRKGEVSQMPVAIITGAGGLIGSEAVEHFIAEGFDVVGIENDMRASFFGPESSTSHVTERLVSEYDSFHWENADIRDVEGVERIFAKHAGRIELVVHTAAQPSHDWAASDPQTDFGVNANGTLNLLEAARAHCPEAPFIFCSTNKVYGDTPNRLPLQSLEKRLELPEDHPYYKGIDTSMSIDSSTHSLFGVSKAAADLLVQEYGRYFEMPTVAFRGGCLTGPQHAGAKLHGFLAYLMKCTVTGTHYTVFGYEGKQVRDNIHSADLIAAFDAFRRAPQPAAVYNIGGGRFSNCSMLEAIDVCERISGRELSWEMGEEPRIGDHRWWISDLAPFQADYPDFELRYGIEEILQEMYEQNLERWTASIA